MKIERTSNASRNIAWGIIEKMVAILLPFITRTVMIKVLGAEYLGLNSLFTSILSVLSISELGFGSAIVFSMYKPISEDDNETICALLNVYKKIYNIIGSIILVCGLCVIPFLPKLISGDYPADINLYVLYVIYLLNTVISYYLFAYKTALFSAYQRNDLASKISAIINFLSNIVCTLVLFTVRNYYAYTLVIPLTTIATNVATAYLSKKTFPDIVCKGNISKDMKEGIKKRIIGLLSFKIYNVIFTSVDTIVISGFLGLTPLAIFNNYYYIQSGVVAFLSVLTNSITAGVGNKMVTDSKEENYSDFKKFVFANGWICSWCAVCLFCLYQHFMVIWMGEELVFPFSTMLLMVLYFLIPRITTMTYTYREAAGLWWEDRFRPLVSTVFNLVINIVLVKLIGMNGVIISTLLCTVLINVPWGTIILFNKYFMCSPKEYFLKIIYYIAVTVVASGVSLAVCNLFTSAGIIALFVKFLICVIVPNIVFWLFYRKMSEYSYLKWLVKQLFNSAVKKIKGKG